MIYSKFEYVITKIMQGDSGGKVSILGGESIGPCEEKSSYEHVSNSKSLPRRSCLRLQIEKHCEW
jgi:hypothetical protein